MLATQAVEDLASLLRQLKDRTGRSYESLAGRADISRSALHRYCSGAAVPTEFEVLSRLGRVCGASREELLELHRRWAVACAAQTNTASTTAPAAGPPVDSVPAGSSPTPPPAEPTVIASAPTVASTVAGDPPVPPGAVTGPTGAMRGPAHRVLLGALVIALLGTAGWFVTVGAPAGVAANDKGRLRTGCGDKIFMGQNDDCVREVQRLLLARGAKIGVDGAFGPETLRRVTAFQLLAGLPPTGVVDEATKAALQAGKVSMSSWPKDRVEARIREVFVEDPQGAVRVAQCASLLDPLYVLPNTDGSRNWGVFQLSDGTLARRGGTRLQAFDPEWNIAAAHAEWSEHRDFRDWVHCDPKTAAASSAPTSTAAARTKP